MRSEPFTIREDRLLALEVPGMTPGIVHAEIVILPTRSEELALGTLDRPWTMVCEGCDGEGHLGRRVPPRAGPCECCWGTGRVLYAFAADTDDGLRSVLIPPHIAATYMFGVLGERGAWL